MDLLGEDAVKYPSRLLMVARAFRGLVEDLEAQLDAARSKLSAFDASPKQEFLKD